MQKTTRVRFTAYATVVADLQLQLHDGYCFKKKSYRGCCVATQKVHALSGYCHVLGPQEPDARDGEDQPASESIYYEANMKL